MIGTAGDSLMGTVLVTDGHTEGGWVHAGCGSGAAGGSAEFGDTSERHGLLFRFLTAPGGQARELAH
jgi:hypothetical protein